MRAHIYGRKKRFTTRSTRRRVGWVHWYASVTDPETGRVLWSDDCRDLVKLADSARKVAAAFTVCAELGQTFRPWSDICEEAGADL